jgi:ADP-ribose pyrophosphatase YjhB (NUDIX family)
MARPGNRRPASVKLLRTIRLDPSDSFIFERAAEPGEWAVPGAFVFWNDDPTTLAGKVRAAFRAGFLGIESLGHSTLAQIVDASETDRAHVVDILAHQLVAHFGAPGLAEAHTAAEEEVVFAVSLCMHPPGTLIAMHRTHENGETRETFRALRRSAGAKQLRAFSFLEVEGDEKDSGAVDLHNLAQGERK